MVHTKKIENIMNDKLIIERLGGVNVVSKALGYEYNTVYNWTTRGISAFAKVKYPHLFMPAKLSDLKKLEVVKK